MSTQNAFNTLQTLLIHSVAFPHPTMGNKPEMFGIDATSVDIKKFMSLGACKLFPEEVQREVFGSLENSPIHKWELIRSRFQAFISSYTFEFMHGAARSLPAAKLPACTALEDRLRSEGEAAKEDYIEHYDELKEASIRFWRARHEFYQISPDQMEQAVRNSFPSLSKIRNHFNFNVIYMEMRAPELLGQFNEIDAMEKQEVLEARNRVAREAGHKLKEEVDSFIGDVAQDLENKTKAALQSLQESIKSGKWNQKSINSVLSFAESFKEINFIGYTDLQAFMDEFKTQLQGYNARDVKADEGLQESLSNFLDESVGQLEEIAEQDKADILSSFGNMGSGRKVRPF